MKPYTQASRSPIPTKSLQVFCHAARLMSFKDAANELYITASAVSHQIRGLEDRLSTPLFIREAKSIQLTDKGALLYRSVGPLLKELEKKVDNFIHLESRVKLRIQLPPFIANEYIIPLLPDFMRDHGTIDLHLHTEQLNPSEHDDSADLSVLLCAQKPPKINSVELFPLVLQPVCAQSYPLDWHKSGDTALSDATLLVYSKRESAWHDWFNEAGYQQNTFKKLIVLESMTAVAKAAKNGLGVALMPDVLINPCVISGKLRPFHPRNLVTEDIYYLGWSKDNEKSPQIEQFITWTTRVTSPNYRTSRSQPSKNTASGTAATA